MDRLKRMLPFIGYGVFYLFVFFMLCYWVFPYDKLRDRLVAEFAAQQKGKPSPQQLEIDEMGPYWFTGIRARGVRLLSSPSSSPADAEAPPKSPPALELDEVHARFHVWNRLIGKTKISFFAKAFGGELDGAWSNSSSESHVESDILDLSVGRIGPLVDLLGLPMVGSLKGNVDFTFPEKRMSKTEGVIKAVITELSIGDGKAKIQNTIALPTLNVGELTLEAEAKEGTLRITKLAASGNDLDLMTEGKVTLRDQPAESTADLYIRFKFSEAYKSKNDLTKSLFGSSNSSIPPLFEMDPKVKQSKRSDGYYGWHMIGPLSNARFDPYSGNAPASFGSGGKGSTLRSGTAP